MGQLFSSADGSQRNLRVALFVIILATLPFYCLGFILWGAAPAVPAALRETATPTLPPSTHLPTNTPSPTSEVLLPFITATSISPLQPTPLQFLPPGSSFNPLPTVFIPPTATPVIVIPTATPAPTLTPIPSETPEPLMTATTIPFFPTDTPDNGGGQENVTNDESFLPPLDDSAPTPTQEEA